MKVVQLGPYPPPHGGVQSNLAAIREALRRGGHECDVINLTRNRKPDADGVYYPGSASELARLLRRLPADILHLHFGGDLTARLLGLLFYCTMLPGRKTVLTFHSGGYPSSPAGRTAAPGTLRGVIFRRLDAAIAVNAELAELFAKFGVRRDRIHTILPFTVKMPDRAMPLPERLSAFFAAHHPVLLTVGLLEPEYDLRLQIGAMAAIRERLPRAGLVIAGAGSLEDDLRRRIAACACPEDILLYGDMPHEVTLRAMLDAGALLRTTLYDGDSVSVREALYLGTPVIASENGMRPAGVRLIPMSDAAALRDAVCELFSTPRTPPAPAGDGQENVRLVLELYQDLLKRPTRGGSEYRRA
jgi:glycosyltransferase involved in cell wall biosynthesis